MPLTFLPLMSLKKFPWVIVAVPHIIGVPMLICFYIQVILYEPI